MRPTPTDVLDRVLDAISSYDDGVHQLGEPAFVLDSALPNSVADLYRTFDGALLFNEELVIFPSTRLCRRGEAFVIGEVQGDDLLVEPTGHVVRVEKDTGDAIVEGTSIDRWLSGFVDAASLLYERDGEFRDAVFTDSGEIETSVELRRQRCFVKRDPKAPGPRWRLARQLAVAGELDEARNHLEQAVATLPDFDWAWFDLAKISERLGQYGGASDEIEEAIRAAKGADHEGFFLAHLARIAKKSGADEERQRAAARAVSADPRLVENLLAGADAELAAKGDARGIYDLLASVAPSDLRVIDLGRRLP